ncbi:MAG: RNase adapter RapZ [Actinobacteria bacterium]|nr:RNase adapter RapZ [Actinomycetota bacterium]
METSQLDVSTLLEPAGGPDLIVITGMSGAGRTEAMHTFEDLGYFCIDNLPPKLLMNLVSLAGLQSGSLRKLAIVCDLRSKEFFPELVGELRHLDDINISHTLLFLDASDEALLRRFKTNRRRHPMCEDGMTIIGGVRREREMLSEIREIANYVIDTSELRSQELRNLIREQYAGQDAAERGLRVNVFSFGFKYGSPIDADIIIDVRFLPNPYYVDELRPLTGLDDKVRDYVLDSSQTKDFLEKWYALLDTITPGYVAEGKQNLSIGVGCTGGQHRSIVLADETGKHLLNNGFNVTITHRDISLAEVPS